MSLGPNSTNTMATCTRMDFRVSRRVKMIQNRQIHKATRKRRKCLSLLRSPTEKAVFLKNTVERTSDFSEVLNKASEIVTQPQETHKGYEELETRGLHAFSGS